MLHLKHNLYNGAWFSEYSHFVLIRNCCNFPSKNLHKCYSMTDPPSKNQNQKKGSPVDRGIEMILFLFQFLLLSVSAFSLPLIHRWNQLAKFSPYSDVNDHPHEQIIYRIQLLQIKSQIVNQGHSASPVHKSLNSSLAKNAANLDLLISFIYLFIFAHLDLAI